MANLRVTYDPKADAAYIYFTRRDEEGEGIITTVRMGGSSLSVIADLDATYRIAGIEFLGASHTLPRALLEQAEILNDDPSEAP